MEIKKVYLDFSFLFCVSLMCKVFGLFCLYVWYGEVSNLMMVDVNVVGVGWFIWVYWCFGKIMVFENNDVIMDIVI